MRSDIPAQGIKWRNSIPTWFRGSLYTDFLAKLAVKRGTRNYLEIGVHLGDTFSRIGCDTAVGLDPGFVLNTNIAAGKRRVLLYQQTSDSFFRDHDLVSILQGRVDLAFLDGLHQFEVLLRDFANAEAVSSPNGLICLHDCMPVNAEMATRDPALPRTDELAAMWTGDVWKIVPILKAWRPDLRVLLVDCLPTGLVCVSGLDPTSRVLHERYLSIVEEYRAVPSDGAHLAAFYKSNPIVSSAAILNGLDHGLFFRV